MAKYIKINSTKEAITFEEFIQYGKDNGANLVNGFPWSFEYKEFFVTHESDTQYLLSKQDINIEFTPELILITDDLGTYPLMKDTFLCSYEKL